MDLQLIRRKATVELTLIVFFFIISAYMFFVAQSFSAAASRFPMFSSAVIVFLSIYLLFRNLYNGYDSPQEDDLVQNIVSSTTDEIEIDEEDQKESALDETNINYIFISVILIFVALSYVIGIFYSSLVFTAMYGLWRERTWYETMATVVLTYLIGSFFIIVLNVDLHTGIIDSGMILW